MSLMKIFKKRKKGSALIMTMFILAGILIVAMSGAYLILRGINSGILQSESVKAYFIAESGAENILWEFRQNSADYGTGNIGTGVALKVQDLGGNTSYRILHIENPNTLHNYKSVGNYRNVKRSVEVSF
jgi:uncharacterized protein (UPF0333 family)